MSEILLQEIEDLDGYIQSLWAVLLDLQHEYLTGKGWVIEDNSGDDFVTMYMYYKDDFITMDADHAMEHELEPSLP